MQTAILVGAIALIALFFNWLLTKRMATREADALLALEDLAALGEVVPDTLHPVVDPDRCIGSGACVRACPEKQVIEVVHGQAKLVNPLACVGHAACVAACPVDALRVVFGTATRGVELPEIDPHFQTTRAGLYVIGELAGMGLIRNAIRQGRQAGDHIVEGTRRGRNGAWDAVVVGAGPAGISATLRLLEAGFRVKLLEREGFGGTILHYPRAKVVMTGTLEIPNFGNVRRRKMSKEELLALWEKIRVTTNLPVETGTLVEGVEEEDDGTWIVTTNRGKERAANVLLALGRRGSPRKLDVAGEDSPKVSYRLLEPREFAKKHVLVIGGGNSAVESVISLVDAGVCASVAISYRRNAFARCRDENRRRIEEILSARKAFALMPSEVQEIRSREVVLKMGGVSKTLKNDSVIVQIGGVAPSELLAKFGVSVVTKYGER